MLSFQKKPEQIDEKELARLLKLGIKAWED